MVVSYIGSVTIRYIESHESVIREGMELRKADREIVKGLMFISTLVIVTIVWLVASLCTENLYFFMMPIYVLIILTYAALDVGFFPPLVFSTLKWICYLWMITDFIYVSMITLFPNSDRYLNNPL